MLNQSKRKKRKEKKTKQLVPISYPILPISMSISYALHRMESHNT